MLNDVKSKLRNHERLKKLKPIMGERIRSLLSREVTINSKIEKSLNLNKENHEQSTHNG